MPGCPYFIANTFGHLLFGLLFTGISAENPIITNIHKKPLTNLGLFILTIPILYFITVGEVGPFKYLAAIAFCLLLGQSISGLAKTLSMTGQLSSVLTNTAVVFCSMCLVGLLDNQNLLGFGLYLGAALAALVLVYIVSLFIPVKERVDMGLTVWVNRLVVILFTFYVAFDVEVLKERALMCKKGGGDYVAESVNLYLDFLNLFTGLSNS